MAKQRPDFWRIIQGAADFIASINAGPAPGGLAQGVLDLATARDLDTSGNDAAIYQDFNPPWTVDVADVGSELDAIEDLAPIIRLDVLDWPHDEFDQSADNYRQYWRLECMLGIASLGNSRRDAIQRYFDVCSVLVDSWMGDGSYLALDRTQSGIEHSSLVGGRWASAARGDQFLCSGFMLLRIRLRWRQTTA